MSPSLSLTKRSFTNGTRDIFRFNSEPRQSTRQISRHVTLHQLGESWPYTSEEKEHQRNGRKFWIIFLRNSATTLWTKSDSMTTVHISATSTSTGDHIRGTLCATLFTSQIRSSNFYGIQWEDAKQGEPCGISNHLDWYGPGATETIHVGSSE